METNWKKIRRAFDPSGMLLSLSGIVLGELFAVAEYHVSWGVALALVLTTVLIHIYMMNSNKWWMIASIASAASGFSSDKSRIV